MDGLEYYGQVNFLKGALLYADAITTVSRRYALEIQTAEYGVGLDGVLRQRAAHLVGILNGVDYAEWDPATDRFIAARYSPLDLKGKEACKRDLLREFGLPDADLILGTGDPDYERIFRQLAIRFPGRVAVRIAYDNALAHKIEAGADMFLMPSRYEPSGLNQMYSLRYGTVPIVRATGGLDDTIEEFNSDTGEGTGFKFLAYSGKALIAAVSRALAVFAEPTKWRKLMLNGMAKDFSWNHSAGEYHSLYRGLARRTPPKGDVAGIPSV
jgi:starch synthase